MSSCSERLWSDMPCTANAPSTSPVVAKAQDRLQLDSPWSFTWVTAPLNRQSMSALTSEASRTRNNVATRQVFIIASALLGDGGHRGKERVACGCTSRGPQVLLLESR